MINQITSTVLKQYSSLLQERADVVTSSAKPTPPIQVTSFSPESSLRVVNDNVVDGIDKELAKNNVDSVRKLDPQNFTPESVAKGILKFVQNAISRAETRGEATDKMLDQAIAGIEKGFSDAKNILQGLNALSGRIAQGVQQTYDLIQVGLQELGQAQVDGTTVNFDREAMSVNQQSQSQSIELNVQTKEGDDVNIVLSQNSTSDEYIATLAKRSSTTVESQFTTSTSNNLSLTVNGNLSEAEVKSIENLLSKVKILSENFFNDDVGAAFEAGFNLGFNTGEIASFALALNENQTQTASKAYREVSAFSNDNRVAPTQLESLLKPASEFMKTLKADVSDNGNVTKDLFDYFSRSNTNNSNQIARLESMADGSFEDISKQLISTVK